MDPYATLGVARSADKQTLKKAYRKAAMKWHPDRAGDSPQAQEKFQQICDAYQELLRGFNGGGHDAASASSTNTGSEDQFTNSMHDYAARLMRAGLDRQQISARLREKGCDDLLAASIADQVFGFEWRSHEPDFSAANDPDSPAKKETGHNATAAGKRKFDYDTIQAILGLEKPSRKQRRSICAYQDAINALHDIDDSGWISPLSRNSYLSHVFNRALLLFLLISVLAVYLPRALVIPGWSLLDYFQLPNMALALMLIWAAYRKLWTLSAMGAVVFALTQLYFYRVFPASLDYEVAGLLLLASGCFVPFWMLSRLSNYFLYRKANALIDSLERWYPKLEGRNLVIRQQWGVSKLAALGLSLALGLYFLQVVPAGGSLRDKFEELSVDGADSQNQDTPQPGPRATQAVQQFEAGWRYFNAQPPDYKRARQAFSRSAHYGSLLAAYSAGYLYLNGLGGERSDEKAVRYFSQAARASLAEQPHDLMLASQWLSEASYSLGLMYLGGWGVERNRDAALKMFERAVKYQPSIQGVRSLTARTGNLRHPGTLVKPPKFHILGK